MYFMFIQNNIYIYVVISMTKYNALICMTALVPRSHQLILIR